MSETTQVTAPAQATTDAAPTSGVATSTPVAAPADSTPSAQQAATTTAPAVDPAVATPAAKVVPEQYEQFKLPEGMQADTEVMTELQTIAKELKLSQDEAQKVNDVGVKAIQKLVTQQQEAMQKARDSWDAATKTDKEFGGDNLKASISVAEKALNAFGTPELFALLDESGLRKHPEIIRAFYRAGKAISDDRFVPSGQKPNQGGVDAAKVLYPNN
jgi:hypothetical protein